MQDQIMHGSHPGHLPPASKTHGTDRVCESPDCETKLSMYNPARRCWQHAEVVFPSYRGKRLGRGTA